MSVGPVTWRPAGNRDPDLARALFETALADWQSRWFGRPCFSLGDVASLPGTPPEPDARAQTSHWCAPGVRIDMSERSDRRLIDAAFAAGGHAFDNPACHDFLASIAAEIRDDLIASLCASPASSQTASAPAGNDFPPPPHRSAATVIFGWRSSRRTATRLRCCSATSGTSGTTAHPTRAPPRVRASTSG